MGGSIGKIVDTAVNVGSLGTIKTDFAGEGAADAAGDAARLSGNAQVAAAQVAANAQREALDYLKEKEELPQQFRESALKGLAGLYGMEGGEGSQQELIDQAMQSPMYKAMMGGQQAGEEAIMRNAAATGGLRSGNVQHALYDYNTQLKNQAMLESYNQQLSGLSNMAQLPSYARDIASGTAAIGQTLGEGEAARGNILAQGMMGKQAAQQQGMNDLMNLGSTAAMAYMAYSDKRLKKDIQFIGTKNGHNWYRWTWNHLAKKLGLLGTQEGVIAQEVQKTNPDSVQSHQGYLTVNYEALGV